MLTGDFTEEDKKLHEEFERKIAEVAAEAAAKLGVSAVWIVATVDHGAERGFMLMDGGSLPVPAPDFYIKMGAIAYQYAMQQAQEESGGGTKH